MPRISIQTRLDEDTHRRLKAIAEKECRSMNAQLEFFVLKGIQEYEAANKSAAIPYSEQ